jgi:hypothetical protein
VLVYRARKGGAKNLEAAINKAAEQSGVEIRTIKRDLAEARSLLDLKRFKFKESDLMGVVRRLSQVNTGRDYDISPAALTERFMGPDTK